MIFKDYYKILGLENNKVTQEDIKQAYREQAKKYHPDVNIGDRISEERFKDINEAYRVLSNHVSKRRYDRMWVSRIGNKKKKQNYEESKRSKNDIFSEFFHMFFGSEINQEDNETSNKRNKKHAPIKGENIETAISISVEDAFYGLNKKISLRTVDGNMKTFDIKIPAGIRNNEKIRLIGQGKMGQFGGKNGDLFIKIQIEADTKFELAGYDIYTHLALTPWEAALGTRINLEGIDDTVSVYIPAGIESGEKLRIPAKGYKDGKGGRGDLIATVKIMVPKKLTKQEKEIFEKLKEISKFNPRSKRGRKKSS
ncbi:MAG: DnaJ domain-containing protein [Clostridia bacterium]|nr:DnaJ domain-containing protein [Clostridia bacterium]